MRAYVLGFQEVDRTDIGRVGGKGAGLGALSRLEGVRVPAGFCVSTRAFERVVGAAPAVGELLDRLTRVAAEDREAVRALAAAIRGVIEEAVIPEDVEAAVTRALAGLGAPGACAVRSSATAEDAPAASFAGQHDSYLNVVGQPAVLHAIRRCWASLFTERAVAYRLRHGFDHRAVRMAVVVQKMLRPQAAGVLFTADPVTGHREVAAIEAAPGLGDALVADRARADRYAVRDGRVAEAAVEPERRGRPVLTEAQILRLARLGRQIEAHFGWPQDIEWCLVDDELHVVQSRPITTLYPLPETRERGHRVYVSVGHQQMMTDALKPLGRSLFQLTAARRMYAAGGRLFVDVTRELASPASRDALLNGLGRSDPLVGDALATLLARGDFVDASPGGPNPPGPGRGQPGPPLADLQASPEDDAALVADLVARSQASIEALKRDLRTKSGTALLDFILEDVERLKRSLTEPRSFGAILAGMNAAAWINEHMAAWLGEKSAADTLSRSAPNNVTAEMGLALLDVADAIRPYPAVVAYLRRATDEGFLEGLLPLEGGRAAHDALRAYLDRYGMRCVGEIDVTRPRWREAPTALVPLILGHLANFEPGAGRRRFEQGQREAVEKEQALLARLRRLPEGDQKVAETQRMVRRLRTFIGYREYPKYALVHRYFLYEQALQDEAGRLVRAQVLRERGDIDFLTLPELREVVRTGELDARLVAERKAEHARHRRLTPPRVLTSDGEVVTGAHPRAGLPAAALVGLAVSAGVVEGRARVLSDLADAALEAGAILVTAFTDPSWTPAFVSVAGLVTEVGGRMTHGAVVAREYGLPAVVGVPNATALIRDGQRIRVHGTDGYVEVLA